MTVSLRGAAPPDPIAARLPGGRTVGRSGSALMTERVTVTMDEGVADVRMNRPDKLNALDAEMFVALADAGARLAADPAVRAVVLSGAGRAFSAGLDFSGFMVMAGRDDGEGDAEGETPAGGRRQGD